jgi:hypothetical protein
LHINEAAQDYASKIDETVGSLRAGHKCRFRSGLLVVPR